MVNCAQCGAEHETHEQACPSCGHDRYLELEIGAFQGPAIERARKWILAVGVLYVAGALFDYFRFRAAVAEFPLVGSSAVSRAITS